MLLMGKAISMAISNSYVSLPEGVYTCIYVYIYTLYMYSRYDIFGWIIKIKNMNYRLHKNESTHVMIIIIIIIII